MKEKQSSKFRKFAIIFSASWIALTAIICLILWSFLGVYEKSTPVYAGKALIELFKAGRYSEVVEKCAVPLEGAFDVDSYETYIKTSLGEKLDDVRIYEGIADEDGNRILEMLGKSGNPVKFYLTENKKTLGYGLSSYSLKQCPIETLTYRFVVPEEFPFTVDGKTVELESKTRDVVENFDVFETQNSIPFTKAGEITGFLSEPKVEIPSLDSDRYTVKLDNGEFTVTITPDEETKEKVENAAAKIGSTFAKYLFSDATYSQLGALSMTDSSSYIRLKTYDRMWVPTHKSYKLRKVRVSNMQQYSKNAFSANVKLDYSIVKESKIRTYEKSYPCDYNVFMIDVDGELKMAAIEMN